MDASESAKNKLNDAENVNNCADGRHFVNCNILNIGLSDTQNFNFFIKRLYIDVYYSSYLSKKCQNIGIFYINRQKNDLLVI
jgi:hypothetical protein